MLILKEKTYPLNKTVVAKINIFKSPFKFTDRTSSPVCFKRNGPCLSGLAVVADHLFHGFLI